MFPDDVTSAEIKDKLAQIVNDKKVDLIIGSFLINPTAATITDLEAAGAVGTDEIITGLHLTDLNHVPDLIADLQVGKPDDQLFFAPVLSQKTQQWVRCLLS